MEDLIPGQKYNIKNIYRTSFEHVVEYIMQQRLPSIDNKVWETFCYTMPNNSNRINRIIIPPGGIMKIVGEIILCKEYFKSGSFSYEFEKNIQEVKEWLIMVKRITEGNSSKIMCANAPFKKNFLFLN